MSITTSLAGNRKVLFAAAAIVVLVGIVVAVAAALAPGQTGKASAADFEAPLPTTTAYVGDDFPSDAGNVNIGIFDDSVSIGVFEQ